MNYCRLTALALSAAVGGSAHALADSLSVSASNDAREGIPELRNEAEPSITPTPPTTSELAHSISTAPPSILTPYASNDSDGAREAIQLILEAGRIGWDALQRLRSHHPTEHWTGKHLRMPIRYIETQDSRVGNNIDKGPFAGRCQVVRIRFQNVRDEDLHQVRLTWLADKPGLADQPRSTSVGHDAIFAMATPTNRDHNFYPGRIVYRGDSSDDARRRFFDRNPEAEIILEVMDLDDLCGALLCEHADYTGWGVYLPSGSDVANLHQAHYGQGDRISSVIVCGDTSVTLYEHSEYRGSRKSFDTAVADIHRTPHSFGDRASSVRVR